MGPETTATSRRLLADKSVRPTLLCSNKPVTLRDALSSAISRLTAANVPSPRMNAELLPDVHPGMRPRLSPCSSRTQALRGRTAPATTRPSPSANAACRPSTSLDTRNSGAWTSSSAPRRAHSPSGNRARDRDGIWIVWGGRPRPPFALRIVDVGTGSGCIASGAGQRVADAEIHATDISPAALEIARANAARHQFEDVVHFHQTDLLPGARSRQFRFRRFQSRRTLANRKTDQVQLEVRKHEPRNAVFAGETGLEVIERLIPQARESLKPGGWLVMEISGTIAERVRELLAGWNDVQITKDLQGIPRVASARIT